VVGKWVGLCKEDFRDLYQSTAVVGMIKSVGKKWKEHVVISYVQTGGRWGRRRVTLSVKILYHSTLKSYSKIQK